MNTSTYLDRLLLCYSNTFDIYKPYTINQKEYPAYGYFYSHVEKYVLVKEVNMWSSNSYEHILFVTPDELTSELLDEYMNVVKNYMEPVLVRKGEQFPEENHMYSYMTINVIANKPLSPEVKKRIRKFKYEKGYKFNMRGFSQAHIAVATMEDEKVYTNFVNRKNKKLFKQVFSDVKENKIGFEEALAKQGIECFKQA